MAKVNSRMFGKPFTVCLVQAAAAHDHANRLVVKALKNRLAREPGESCPFPPPGGNPATVPP
jgi:hypothetical protein